MKTGCAALFGALENNHTLTQLNISSGAGIHRNRVGLQAHDYLSCVLTIRGAMHLVDCYVSIKYFLTY